MPLLICAPQQWINFWINMALLKILFRLYHWWFSHRCGSFWWCQDSLIGKWEPASPPWQQTSQAEAQIRYLEQQLEQTRNRVDDLEKKAYLHGYSCRRADGVDYTLKNIEQERSKSHRETDDYYTQGQELSRDQDQYHECEREDQEYAWDMRCTMEESRSMARPTYSKYQTQGAGLSRQQPPTSWPPTTQPPFPQPPSPRPQPQPLTE